MKLHYGCCDNLTTGSQDQYVELLSPVLYRSACYTAFHFFSPSLLPPVSGQFKSFQS